MDDLEFRIAKLELGPGDVLVVKLDHKPTQELAARVARYMNHVVQERVPVLILEPGIDLSVLTRTEIESRVEQGVGV